MKIQVNYPARTIEKRVKRIRIELFSNRAYVELSGEHPETIMVDLNKKNITLGVRNFLAEIIAEASGVNIDDIPKTEILKKQEDDKA